MPPKRNPKSHPRNRKGGNEAAEVNAAAAVADCVLPMDVILSRLPVKPLVRFKAVCKLWYNLHSDPHFIKLHSRQFPLTPKTSFSFKSHLLRCPILGIEPPRKLTFVDPTNFFELFIDACNGLVCLGRPLFTKEIVLWNPATDMWKTLPHSNAQFGAASIVSLGFGCNAEGDDFKVVRIACLKGKKKKVGIEVYSSKSDAWRTIGIDVEYPFELVECKNHMIVNGNPYWIARIFNNDLSATVLLGFDATEMVFKFARMPNREEMEASAAMPFVAWEGSLGSLVCTKRADDSIEKVDIWVLDEREMQWKMNRRFGRVQPGIPVDYCLDCCRDGRIVGGCSNGRLFVYDPKTDSVVVSEMRKRKHCSFQIFAFDESLAYVKGMVPVATKKEDHKEKFNDIDGFFVSNTEHTGKQLLQKGGLQRRVTIIPLNKIRSDPVSQKVQDYAVKLVDKGNAAVALSLVGYDQEVQISF